ncbi:aspartate ammonia-lyase [Phyllobacterium sp. 0TCS1.6C]|uniref:aspartate ammonia-lyase n=1 Tax=unclassified Phyllobacterium TaxID=2638441 RepID=UPI002264BD02|nr:MULTISPECIES: aspartate ammonia-lyase [unclassified Phyllobacterium]MCX8282363.1 aspartate ammonia-lyase [Phyllobacterium sp. 0TCS1.6C]MCX8295284.1 aspartate ammonia-lyase [Phyllobacterium sp. 0TCS1.6A]
MTATRTETDSLGTRQVASNALYGIATLRGLENFDISAVKLRHIPQLVKALAQIKRAAAQANRDLGVIPRPLADAIAAAAIEVERGAHAGYFVIDLLEGSGGTSINMNMNEVLANRALQLMGEAPGTYSRLHPNDHVNAGQSTNDVVPSALKLAIFDKSHDLLQALGGLADAFAERAETFPDVLRVGRTCLQAGQPMLLGQAFGGYAAGIRRQADRLAETRRQLLVLPLGGTAIGTGLGAVPAYRARVYERLRAIVGEEVQPAGNMFDAMQNADVFSRISADLRVCAEVLGKIASDLAILASDPESGIGELMLPPVQPGSSIMPGKVNPVLPMMMQQVSIAVIGNDMTVSLACLQGQLEINHFEPAIASRIFDSLDLMLRAIRIFTERCVAGIEVDREQTSRNLMQSPAIATFFAGKLGYAEVSRLVKEAQAQKRPFVELAVEKNLLTSAEILDTIRASVELEP